MCKSNNLVTWARFPRHEYNNLVTKARFRLGVRAKKNLGPTLSNFGLLFGHKLLINARTLTSRY
jgi:hypothetical protein